MSGQAQQIADHFFRHEAGKLRAALTRVLGMGYLDLCEDVVQEAMYRALTKWPVGGIPPNPSGWIFRTARNIAIDHIRRDKRIAAKAEEVAEHLKSFYDEDTGTVAAAEIQDSLLRMVFTCCHPELSQESRIVLTLKIVCSFHDKEIASALLKKQEAVEKMVGRGKQKLKLVIDLDAGMQQSMLRKRLEDVRQVVYLLFNEGYKASSGEKLIKEPLCLEAIRLARLLSSHPATNTPPTLALTALLLFHAARFPARVNQEGHLLLLQHQDRSEWDRAVIAEAQRFLNHAATGEEISEYHLLAGIAATHTFAPSFADTNWPLILEHYDMLCATNHSPVILLNRVVAVLMAHGHQAAQLALSELESVPKIRSYYLYYMVEAEIGLRSGARASAMAQLRQAMALTHNKVEKAYIAQKIADCL